MNRLQFALGSGNREPLTIPDGLSRRLGATRSVPLQQECV